MLRGLDVSWAQGTLDAKAWASIAEMGCRFAIIKVAEGVDSRPDVQCVNNVKLAREAGLVVGGYGLVHPLPTTDPVAQAVLHQALVVDCGLGQVGDLPFSCDLELPEPDQWAAKGCSGSQILAWSSRYLEKTSALQGAVPMLYTYPDFWKEAVGALDPSFARYPLWMASYGKPAWPTGGGPLVLRPWTMWAFWQFSGGSMKLPDGRTCDFDVYNGDDLAAVTLKLGSVSFVPPPVEQPTPPDATG